MKKLKVLIQPPTLRALAAVLFIFSQQISAFQVTPNTPVESLVQEPLNEAPPAKNNKIASDVPNNEEIVEADTVVQEGSEAADSAGNKFDALSAFAWMQRLANTVEQASFEISFVVTGPKQETMPYVWRHTKLDNNDTAEQLSLLNGPGFEQIRINSKVSIFEPGFSPFSIRAQVIDGPIPRAFIHRPDLLFAGYDILLMGRNRVSGRMAQQIRIISKDKSRYQYHLWLDEQTGLFLKQNMYDLQGNLLEQIQVTQMSVNDKVKVHFLNIQTEQLPPFTRTAATRDQQLPWTVSFMPVGMKKVAQNLRRIPITNQLAEYMMISDGLVDVSIYVTQATDVSQEDVAVNSGATSIVSISNGRIQVTVIGEIPLATANEIASSIVLITEPQQ